MSSLERRVRGLTSALVLAGLLAGCSGNGDGVSTGGDGTSPPTGNGPSNETVQGIATPNSVSVVTATNAD